MGRSVAPAYLRSPAAWGGFVEAVAFFDARGTAADVQALPTAVLYDYAQLGLPVVADNACLAFIVLSSTTSSGVIT